MAEALNGIGICLLLAGAAWIGFAIYNAPTSTIGIAAAIYVSAPAIGVLLTGLFFMGIGRMVAHLSRIEGLLEDTVAALNRETTRPL